MYYAHDHTLTRDSHFYRCSKLDLYFIHLPGKTVFESFTATDLGASHVCQYEKNCIMDSYGEFTASVEYFVISTVKSEKIELIFALVSMYIQQQQQQQ